MHDLSGLVEPFVLSSMNPDYGYQIIETRLSLTCNRFDLAFKLLYAKCFKNEKCSEWRFLCYKEHIKAFSLGSFSEPGNDNKNSIDRYVSDFRDIFHAIEKYGFDDTRSLVPLANDGSILNGAHRASASIFLKKNVSAIKTNLPPENYDYLFFKKRGVADEMLDAAAQEFIEYDDTCFLALVWPAAKGRDAELDRIIPKVVYKKNVKLNFNGAHNLLSKAYKNEIWLGPQVSNFPGIRSKLTACFPDFSDVRIFVFQADSIDDVLIIKENIRKIYGIGKHAVHITDNKNETIELSRYLLNDNSIEFLNYGMPNRFIFVQEKIDYFKSQVASNSSEIEDYVLDSGMVMMVYGLRQASDIDYLSISCLFGCGEIEHHDKELEYHGVDENDLVDNPKYYFWYEGVKFICLHQLKILKENRGDKKDKVDLLLIKEVGISRGWGKRISEFKYLYYYNLARMKNNFKGRLVLGLKFFGAYEFARGLYRKAKGK